MTSIERDCVCENPTIDNKGNLKLYLKKIGRNNFSKMLQI